LKDHPDGSDSASLPGSLLAILGHTREAVIPRVIFEAAGPVHEVFQGGLCGGKTPRDLANDLRIVLLMIAVRGGHED
jgi:hypothetical protein